METRHAIPAIDTLEPFDTCVVAGRLADAGVPVNLTADNILPVMDRHGIHEALVTSNFARLHRAHGRGNRWTVDFCRFSPRLHPVWVLEPPAKPGRDAARAAVDAMRAAGARVARLLMGQGGSSPLLWWWEDLLEALRERRVPCLVDFGSANYYDGSTNGVPDDLQIDRLREIVLAFPDLPFILSHACGGLGIANATLPLMARCANLHLDVTSLLDYWRRAVRDLGPERVVFATGMPYFDPGTWVSNVQYEPGLSLEAKRMIMGGNMRRLLEDVR